MGDRFLTRKKTKKRRKTQKCRVFQLKIDYSHLSKNTQHHLQQLFIEAKWFYNYVLSDKIKNANTTLTSVPVKVGDNFEQREFTVLKSHMKQGLKLRAFNACKTLKALKEKGYRIGRLKFKTRVNSIMLQEYGRTFDLDFDNHRIRIQGLKPWLRVSGLDQITKEHEIANAHLVKKASGYYLLVTTFTAKFPNSIPDKSIGIDFGCQTQLTLSNGIKIEYQVKESKRLKRLSRRVNKKVNGKIGKKRQSKNRDKLLAKRRKEYERVTNRKKDIRNKIVNAITKNYKYVCFQDESIHAWQSSGHGKKVQRSAIGGILSDLKHKSETPVVVDKFFPSTQLCPKCGNKNKMPQWKRIYECDCGFRDDRDLKSARCIEVEGMKSIKVPMDYRDVKLEENCSSTFLNALTNINGIRVSKHSSMSQEATGLAPS